MEETLKCWKILWDERNPNFLKVKEELEKVMNWEYSCEWKFIGIGPHNLPDGWDDDLEVFLEQVPLITIDQACEILAIK